MAEALQCPKCQSPMTSRLDVDGLQHTLHAQCPKCGFALDLDDRPASRFSALDRLATVLACLSLFGLVIVAASLEQFQKMVGDFGADLPALTRLTLEYQLPLPFLIVTGVVSGLGAWRRAKGLRGGRALLWIGCAVGVLGAAACLWGLYGPVFEIAGKVSED